MSTATRVILSSALVIACGASAAAQSLPTSQPGVLLIVIEDIKPGHGREHSITEAGWPAAYERAGSKFPYFAFDALTGTPQVWFVSPYGSHAKMAEAFQADEADAALSAELSRLARADAEHLAGVRTVHAVARPALSRGAFPDAGKHRFWEISTFRLRSGSDAVFEAAANAYNAAAGRAAPDAAYRVYQVVAGMPGPTYLVFSSVVSLADFDKLAADGGAIMKAMNAGEQEALSKFTAAVVESETQRFRLDPGMSFVSREVRQQDPAFWMPKN